MQKHQSSHPQVHAWNTLEPNTCNKITNHSFLNRIYTYKKMHKKIIWFYANANPNVPSIGNTTWCAHLSGSHLANPKSEICSSFRIKCLLCTKKKKNSYMLKFTILTYCVPLLHHHCWVICLRLWCLCEWFFLDNLDGDIANLWLPQLLPWTLYSTPNIQNLKCYLMSLSLTFR